MILMILINVKGLTDAHLNRNGSIKIEDLHLKRFPIKVVFITAFRHSCTFTEFQRICLFIRALFFSLRIWVYSTSFLKKGTQDEF